MSNYNFLYKKNGDVFVFGSNNYGKLGLDIDTINGDILRPTLMMNDKNIKIICCGHDHSIIYIYSDINKYKNNLYVIGDNQYGQLGLNDNINRNKLTLLSLDTYDTIKMISCGDDHSIIYKNSGELLVFGKNNNGQLGLGDHNNRNKPTLLMNDKTIKIIYCKNDHSIIYKNNGDLLVFGNNRFGQLGFKDKKDILIPTLLINNINIKNICCASYYTLMYIRLESKLNSVNINKNSNEYNDGDLLILGILECNWPHFYNYKSLSLYTYEDNLILSPLSIHLLLNDKNIKMISSGQSFSIIYKNSGDLLGFGENGCGQLCIGDTLHRDKLTLIMNDKNIKNIYCGWYYTLIYKNNGDLFVCGSSTFGQLGLGNHNSKDKLTLLMNDISIIYINNIAIPGWSPENHKDFSPLFQSKILLFYQCLKRIQLLTGLKIPKFIIYEIIKFIN